MPIPILSRSRFESEVEYTLDYEWLDHPGRYYSFACDEEGVVPESHFAGWPGRRKSWDYVQSHLHEFHQPRVRCHERRIHHPAVGQCSCGTHVVLSDPLDNVCPSCGVVYNMSGYEVVPSWLCDEQGNPFEGE